jgi:hypothetical protein
MNEDRKLELIEFERVLKEVVDTIKLERNNFTHIDNDLIFRLELIHEELTTDLADFEQSPHYTPTLDDFRIGDQVIYQGKVYTLLTKKHRKLRLFRNLDPSIDVEASEVVKYEG